MKKSILFAVAVCVALTSCVKDETETSSALSEGAISYQAVVGSASSKALGSGQLTFPTTSAFGSYAYFLPAGSSWDTNKASATKYIDNQEIKFYSSAVTPFLANTWHSATINYWPKQGSLTFFAYTPKSVSVTCTTDGIAATGFDADGGIDFMVADIAKDKSANVTTYEKNGVPTLFRHKLAQVKFTIKNASDYTNGHTTGSYVAGDKVITLTSVNLNNVKHVGDYAQSTETWTPSGTAKSYEIFKGTQAITTTAAAVGTTKIVLPQTFVTTTGDVTVTYTIKTYTDATNFSTETVTVTKKLYDLQSASSNAWQINKDITYNISIDLSSNIIYWDPAIQNWEASTVEPAI